MKDLPLALKTDWREALILTLIDEIIPIVLNWLFEEEGQRYFVHQSISENWLMKSFLNLLECLLLKDHTRKSLAKKE